MVRKIIAPGGTPTTINKLDKTDKIVKTKNNPYLKRNTLRIQEASKAVDTSSSNRKSCPECGDIHYLFACQQFRNSTTSHKLEVAKNNNLCFNCLSPSHQLSDCYSYKQCEQCKRKHHTLLHQESFNQNHSSSTQQPPTAVHTVDVNTIYPRKTPQHYASVPFTALGLAISRRHRCKVRAQIDTGAGVSLITA